MHDHSTSTSTTGTNPALQREPGEAQAEPETGVEDRTRELNEANTRSGAEAAERKQAEGAIQELKQRVGSHEYYKLVEQASDGFWLLDRRFMTVYVNPALEKMLGYAKEEMIGRSWYDFGDPEWVARAKELEKRRESGISEPHRFLFLHKDGRPVLTRIATTPLYDDSGTFDGALGVLSDITRQQESEDALKIKEMLNNIAQSSGIGICLINPDFTIEWYNNLYAQWFEPIEKTKGRNCYEVFEGRSTVCPGCPSRVTLETGGAATSERAGITTSSGADRVIALTTTPVRNADGQVLQVIEIAQDITERKLMAKNLLDGQRRLANIIEGTNVGTWEWNIHTGETVFNEEWAAIIGYTLDELSPVSIDTWMKYVHPDDLQKSAGLLKKHFSGESDYYECEARMQHKDGHYVWILDRGKVASRSEDGTPLWMFGTHQDISKRKKLEFELVKLAEASPSGIWKTDAHGFNTYVSETWSKITGLSREMAAGHGWTAALHPDDKERVFDEWQKSAPSGATGFQSEFRFLRSDGTVVWVLCLAVPFTDEVHGGQEWVGTISDISLLKEAEAKLLEAKNAAESANHAKSAFLANMSHEIRTPMNGVLGMAQLLALTELNAEQQKYVNALKESGNNLLSLINDILDLSRIEAGRISLEMSPFGIRHCISTVVLTQKSGICQKGLVLDVRIDDAIPHVLIGDQLRIKQILSNLLGNAAKFTKAGSIVISARMIEQHSDSALVELAVRDSGVGIAAEALEKIFSPFVQEESSTTRQFGGSGLGLSITRQLTELMGGTISVESTQGVGSCFSVRIPFAITDTIMSSTAAPDLLEGRSPLDLPSLRILLAEDNPVNIQFSRTLLNKLGHETVIAENGRECLTALENGSFDLVLMDIQMPVMNGEDALREIRKSEQGTGRRQPVIALTAYALRGERDRFMAEGFDGYVSKPMVIEELVAEMKRILQQRDSAGHVSGETAGS